MKLVDMINEVEWKRIDDEAKGQGDDETKIYDGYIRLIGFNIDAKSNLKYLPIGVQNRIAKSQSLTTSA